MANGGELQIAICDDEEYVLDELEQILFKVLKKEQVLGKIFKFSSGRSLLKEIKKIQVVFLDIEMPDLDGIQVGSLLKKKNEDCQIMIASGREDRFKETYRIGAMRFLSKPFDEEEITEALRAYLDQCMAYGDKLEVYKNRNSFQISQRKIEYIAAYKGGVEIMANGILYHKDISLSRLEKELDPVCFFRVHKAYIVNLHHVTDFTEQEIMVGKVRLPLSRRQRQAFKNACMEFDVGYRG